MINLNFDKKYNMIIKLLPIARLKKHIFEISLTLLLCMIPLLASAQMFSVDNSDRDRSIPDIGIYAGIEPINFEYQGDNNQGADQYSFEGSLLRFLVEGRGLSLYVGAGGSATGLEDATYFDAGIKLGYGFTVYRTPKFNLKLPVQIHSTITRVNNDEVVIPGVPEFDQGTLEIAGGLDISAELARQFRFSANVVPSYGLSFSTRQRNASGDILGLEGEARLFFDQLFGSAGLSLGYDYNFREYDISGNDQLLDYNATAHSFLIGVTF